MTTDKPDPSLQYQKLLHVENLDDYLPGGFHPVKLNDRFKDGRYVVVNKLGYGGVSTVWLAHDTHSHHGVALSFIKSQGPRGSIIRQLENMRRLADGPSDHKGRKNILIALDEFEVTGPNGTHTCFVNLVMGQSISVATNRAQGIATGVLPLSMAKQAVVNLTHAISYMTACGIVHADLHPGNLLLGLSNDSDTLDLQAIDRLIGPAQKLPILHIDGKSPETENVPPYAVVAALSHDFEPRSFSANIKVSDFGDSFLESQPPSQTSNIGPYLVPEYASPHRMSCKMDVWLLGCAIYQILSGHDLFGVPDDPAWLVTKNIMDTLGRPPDGMLKEWEADMKSEVLVPEFPINSLEARVKELREGSAERGMRDRRDEFSEEDVRNILELLQLLLVYDPEERPHIDAVLQHPAMGYFEHYEERSS